MNDLRHYSRRKSDGAESVDRVGFWRLMTIVALIYGIMAGFTAGYVTFAEPARAFPESQTQERLNTGELK